MLFYGIDGFLILLTKITLYLYASKNILFLKFVCVCLHVGMCTLECRLGACGIQKILLAPAAGVAQL